MKEEQLVIGRSATTEELVKKIGENIVLLLYWTICFEEVN